MLRKTKRQYYRNLSNEINISRASNPKQFWDYISKLGPIQKYKNFRESIYKWRVTTENLPKVLNKWPNAFNKLYNNNVDNVDNNVDNHDNSLDEGVDKYNTPSTKLDGANYFNNPILLSEVEEVVKS